LGIAFLMNVIMPSLDSNLKHYKQEIEQQFTYIFEQFSNTCIKPNNNVNIAFEELKYTIRKAKSIAFRDVKNHFVRNENSYYHYFDMREEQLELLRRMSVIIENIETKDCLLSKISNLFAEVATNVNSNDYTVLRLHSLYEIRLELNELELPTSHEGFRTRANLFQLLNELEAYLAVKSQFGSLRLHSDQKSAAT
ncbi:aromatic acid exporter family protein, partial [Staphylococcus xylosus]|nr:aromatic acid exporter family protein [Staphylococcus xylosus]